MADEKTMAEVMETPSGGFSWRKLFSFASFGAALVIALVSVFIFKEAAPPFIVMFVLFLVGGILALRTGKAGVVGIVLATLGAAMFTVFAGPFAATVIVLPVAKDEFIPVLSTLTLALTVLISAIVLAVRGRGRGFVASRAAGGIGIVAVALVFVIVGWSLYAASKFESAGAEVDDVLVVTEDTEFTPETLTVDAGTVSVHVTNKDDATHTFTSDELVGVDIVVPAGKSNRVTFTAKAGEYRFYCRPHAPDMDGKLEVS